MLRLNKIISVFFCTIAIAFLSSKSFSDDSDLKNILETIQNDLKTLEKAVYSDSFNVDQNNSSSTLDQNSEDVLTRHLLKLSEIESQFQALTNKFEEINFKVDKLSSRLSKIQADNQLRFQNLENGTEISLDKKKN